MEARQRRVSPEWPLLRRRRRCHRRAARGLPEGEDILLLTTTPKQRPSWRDQMCCTSTGSTRAAPAGIYLNSFFLAHVSPVKGKTSKIMMASFMDTTESGVMMFMSKPQRDSI